MKKDLHWTPVRRGNIYCSPACGGNCKYTAYLKARRDSARLARTLGPQWKTHVWENLGWHWEVTCGAIMLKEHSLGNNTLVYSAMVDCQVPPRGGLAAWTEKEYYDHPLQAVCHAVANARKYVSGLEKPVQQAERDCGLFKDRAYLDLIK